MINRKKKCGEISPHFLFVSFYVLISRDLSRFTFTQCAVINDVRSRRADDLPNFGAVFEKDETAVFHFCPHFVFGERRCGNDGDFVAVFSVITKINHAVVINALRLAERRLAGDVM